MYNLYTPIINNLLVTVSNQKHKKATFTFFPIFNFLSFFVFFFFFFFFFIFYSSIGIFYVFDGPTRMNVIDYWTKTDVLYNTNGIPLQSGTLAVGTSDTTCNVNTLIASVSGNGSSFVVNATGKTKMSKMKM